MAVSTLFFDLDETLYSSECGVWPAIQARMSQYMAERLGLSWEIVPGLRRQYFMTYGTTLRGLQIHHQVDADDYLAYVHDLPIRKLIEPNPELRMMLLSLPQIRWIFTNADANHAGRVIEALGLEGVFEGIVDIRANQFICKPDPLAYHRALALAGEPNPQECVLLDDSANNLATAQQLGLTTVLVGGNGIPDPAADYCLPELLALPQVMPMLWDGHSDGLATIVPGNG